MLESTICLLALVLAGLTVFEIAQWHVTRHLARLALHAAAREGAVTSANPQAIRRAAAIALTSRHGRAKHRLRPPAHAVASLPEQLIGLDSAPWRIDILSPTTPMFSDFADPGLSQDYRQPTIRNDFLAEQHAAHQARGWGEGAGPQSGMDIFDANTLRLRLTVLHALRVPGAATLIRALPATGDPVTDTAHRNGLLPIVVDTDSAMHSHPMLWPETSRHRDDKPLASSARIAQPRADVARQDGNRGNTHPGSQEDAADTSPVPDTASGAATGIGALTSPTHGAGFTPIADMLPKRLGPAADRLNMTAETAALCGILLCCPTN